MGARHLLDDGRDEATATVSRQDRVSATLTRDVEMVPVATARWVTTLALVLSGGMLVATIIIGYNSSVAATTANQNGSTSNQIAQGQYDLAQKAASQTASPTNAPVVLTDGRIIYGGKIWDETKSTPQSAMTPADHQDAASPQPSPSRINGITADGAATETGPLEPLGGQTGDQSLPFPFWLLGTISVVVAVLLAALLISLSTSSVRVRTRSFPILESTIKVVEKQNQNS